MIEKINFKGCLGIRLENKFLQAVILPYLGGKVASLYRKDKTFELLFQNKSDTYRKPKLHDSFADYDAAGFDDAFPSIDADQVIYKKWSLSYPDHGEIWSAKFKYSIVDEAVVLTYQSRLFRYMYCKKLWLQGNRLCCEYDIKNTGSETFPCIWAMHCLIRCEENMELIFPQGTNHVINVQTSDFLGNIGNVYPYPVAEDLTGQKFLFNKVKPVSSRITNKYYVLGKIKEGTCGVYYPDHNIRYILFFDTEKLPYLGFWVTAGGFRGDYNCALEPTNGFYDNIETAKKNNKLYFLPPGNTLHFSLQMELK